MIASSEFLSTSARVKVVVTAVTRVVLVMLPARDGAKGMLW